MSSNKQTVLALILGFAMIYLGKFHVPGDGNLALQQTVTKDVILLLR